MLYVVTTLVHYNPYSPGRGVLIITYHVVLRSPEVFYITWKLATGDSCMYMYMYMWIGVNFELTLLVLRREEHDSNRESLDFG